MHGLDLRGDAISRISVRHAGAGDPPWEDDFAFREDPAYHLARVVNFSRESPTRYVNS